MEIKDKKDEIEDTTKYGEMIPSLYNWLNPDNQRERVRKIDENVKKQNK